MFFVISGCEDGLFGPNCKQKCNCLKNSTSSLADCDGITGKCAFGCEQDFAGPTCSIGEIQEMAKTSP